MTKIFMQAVFCAFDRKTLQGVEKFVDTELPAGRTHNVMNKILKHKNIADIIAFNNISQ